MSLVLPEDVWVIELVHELHLLEHVGPVRAVLVHLEHHHLPRRLVGHLKQSRQESRLGKGKTAIHHFVTRHAPWTGSNGETCGISLHSSFRVFPTD